MSERFNLVVETALRRYQNNTLVVGDRVKFIENFLAHEWTKAQPELKVERLKELIESGANIRISAVKTSKPPTAESGHFEIVDGVFYDIVREEAPGMYTQVFTVPENLVILEDDYPNLAGETPEHLIKQDPSQIKPGEVEIEDQDVELNPIKQTSSNEGDRDLPKVNTNIETEPAAKSYTGKYLEG